MDPTIFFLSFILSWALLAWLIISSASENDRLVDVRNAYRDALVVREAKLTLISAELAAIREEFLQESSGGEKYIMARPYLGRLESLLSLIGHEPFSPPPRPDSSNRDDFDCDVDE